jgi:hypothetical protein
MKNLHAGISIAAVYLALGSPILSLAQNGTIGGPNSQAPTEKKGSLVMHHASGSFDVKVSPLALDDKTEGTMLGRMGIEKQYHGDLEATAKGEMLTAGTAVKGSAGYVAIERVSGSLQGRSGTFVLQHTGTMTQGAPQLSITVVPDSGTGQLVGLTGKLEIKVVDGKHSYEFDYTLAEAK